MREICAGINVDIGTAAAFREQWAKEASAVVANSALDVIPKQSSRRLLLITDQAPGDAVAMTAAIYSLHKAHPDKYVTAVKSPYPDVFAHNPHVDIAMDGEELRMHYPAIHQSNTRGIHFMQAYCEFLGDALGIDVPLLTNRPHLYFPNPQSPPSDYWVVCAGGKRDFTNKQWGGYQEVVSSLKGKVVFFQVGHANDDHPRIRDAVDVVGKTTLRGLFNLVRNAQGVLCGVSLLMHVAAAMEKPAIVVAGGREPVAWNAYPRQHYLHTVGVLPCSDAAGHVGGACWRSRTVPLGDGSALDNHICERPIGSVPECMTIIKPATVADLIIRYNDYGEDTAALPR